MKKLAFASFLSVICAISSPVLADNKLCIGINNFGTTPIRVSALDSVVEHTLLPAQKIILSEKDLSGSCYANYGCEIFITPIDENNNPHGTLIKVAKGSRIIYSLPNLYYVNEKAEVPCILDEDVNKAVK